MSNNIPIDELFREKLSGGKEQLNLGAWANMERMLDGQNPYAGNEEPKKKRRILPFFFSFIMLTAAVSAGYLYYAHNNNHAPKLSHATNANSNNNQSNSDASLTNHTDLNTPNQVNTPDHIKNTPNQINIASESKIGRFTPQAPVRRSKHESSNSQHLAASSSTDLDEEPKISPKDVVENQAASRKQTDEPLLASNGDKAAFVKNSFKETSDLMAGNTIKDGARSKMNVKGADEKANVKNVKVNRTIAEVKESRNRNGSVNKTELDTIDESTIDKQIAFIEPVNDQVNHDKNYKYHPRYVNGAEDYVADQQNVLYAQAPVYTPAPDVKTPSLQNAADGKSKKRDNEKKNVIATLGAFAGATLAKVAESGGNFFRMFSVLDPGISLGVNAALFNTKNNYGGFHAGITNHTSISETFSVFTELKFFLRNNAGFTVNDIKTVMKGYNQDNISSPGNTIHKYDVDSSTKRYNFSNFMSLELPVMLNAKFNKLSVYGGPNFVYNFGLKIKEVTTNYPPPAKQKEVELPAGAPFSLPMEKSFQYVRSDFGARFGIGYAVGVSYNFNPKIYLDLRLSKVMWDNTKTNTQREISNGVTKVPFTQLSLGYKFKNK